MQQPKSFLRLKMLGQIGLATFMFLGLTVGCAGGRVVGPIMNGAPVTQNSISVSGTGDAYGTPDVADLQLGIDVKAGDAGQAIKQANDIMNAVRDAVKGKGVDEKDMQTINFNVYPEDVTDKTTGQPTGQRVYHVQNFLNVKVKDITRIGDVIDAGLGAGATNVSGLSFSVQDTSKLEAEARNRAIADAKARAQQLADGLGVKLGAPIIVTEGIVSPPPPYSAFSTADGKSTASDGTTSVNPGQLQITVQVNISFAIQN